MASWIAAAFRWFMRGTSLGDATPTDAEAAKRWDSSEPEGPSAATTDLIARLESPDAEERAAAAREAGETPSPPLVLLDALAGRLFDDSESVKLAAVEAVHRLGPAAARALDALEELATDSSPAVREAADAAWEDIADYDIDAWREEGVLVVRRGEVLPPRCVICGDADRVEMRLLSLGYARALSPLGMTLALLTVLLVPVFAGLGTPGARLACLAILLGVPVAAIAGAATGRVSVEVGLCPSHRKRRSRLLVVDAAVSIVGIALIVYGLFRLMDPSGGELHLGLVLGGFAVLFAGRVALMWRRDWISALKPEGELIRLKGVTESYLMTLPRTTSDPDFDGVA